MSDETVSNVPSKELTTEPCHRVIRCVQMLDDDFHRQSGYLHADDVYRLLSRRHLSPTEGILVWRQLRERGIAVADVNDTDVKPPPTNVVGVRASRQGDLPPCYGSHALLTPRDEIYLSRRIRASRKDDEEDYDTSFDADHRHTGIVGEAARATLILSNIRLVLQCASTFRRITTIPFDDLVQEGICGLHRATEKYDPERGFKFSTYATWWINQRILRAIQNSSRMVRIPTHIYPRLRQLRRRQRSLQAAFGRQPSVEELAKELGWDASEIEFLLQVQEDTRSLDKPLATDSDDVGLASRLSDDSEIPDRNAEREELRGLVAKVLATLDDRSRRVIELRFGLRGTTPRTLEHVGQLMGVTRERIRQIEHKALQRISKGYRGAILRKYMDIPEPLTVEDEDE